MDEFDRRDGRSMVDGEEMASRRKQVGISAKSKSMLEKYVTLEYVL